MTLLRKSALLMVVIALSCVTPVAASTQAQNPSPRAREVGPRLKEPEVIEIAKSVAAKKGHDLSNYEMFDVTFSAKNKNWSVHLNGKSRIIGDHFSVIVDDRKKTTRYWPGM